MACPQQMVRAAIILCLLASLSLPTYATPAMSDSTFAGKQGAELATDRARYAPGDTVRVSWSYHRLVDEGELSIQIFCTDTVIETMTRAVRSRSEVSWMWRAPKNDYQGYLVQAVLTSGGKELDRSTIGVDVSSDWTLYPRYGFVSSYPSMSRPEIDSIVERLNRYHINGLQFYDWQYKHHHPLKGKTETLASQWKDIANRAVHVRTIQEYIDAAHQRGMMAMAYNLLYGAYADAADDGVDTARWSIYKDPQHRTRFMYSLPAGWASSLYFMNPANKEWQAYLFRQESDVFRALRFDGWHVDQVGDPGAAYDYDGNKIPLTQSFASFLKNAKAVLNVRLVMNAVNQYGQKEIAAAPVDFLYSEIWDCARTYEDLRTIIEDNRTFSGGKRNSVLAAYMDYDRTDQPHVFNTPGVLLTDAVIMASGGDHIELGEHMLNHEYFPNARLQMTEELQMRLRTYYDFFVAYENILRGNDVRVSRNVPLLEDSTTFSTREKVGAVWYLARESSSRQVFHLINLVGVENLEWRDRYGHQSEPRVLADLPFTMKSDRHVRKIWFASPDVDGGAPRELPFSISQNRISCLLPRLEYWDMVVVEYED